MISDPKTNHKKVYVIRVIPFWDVCGLPPLKSPFGAMGFSKVFSLQRQRTDAFATGSSF